MVKNKVVVITGASQGLGRELAKQLAKLGAKLALIARTEPLLVSLLRELKPMDTECKYYVCDVTNQTQVNNTIDEIHKTFGTIDVVVNGAGIWTTDEFEVQRPELVERSFQVNSIGPIYVTKAVLPHMREKNSGHLMYVISKAGLDIPENKDWPTYTATKWAVTGYTQALKGQLSDTKIKVSRLFPGGFESNIFETAGEKDAHNQSWMMRTEDVAKSIVYILDAPDDLWINTVGLSNI